MKRNLISQKGSFTLTLPKNWVTKKNLGSGSEIDIEELSEGLLISAKTQNKKKEITVNFSNDSQRLMRIRLWNLYRSGYEKISINVKTTAQKQYILSIVNNHLLGFELTNDSSPIILENVAEPSAEKQDVLLRRMFLIIKDSLDTLSQDIELGKLNNANKILESARKIVQYDNFCRRNIYKKRLEDEGAYYYWGLLNYLLLLHQGIYHLYKNKLSKKNTSLITIIEDIKIDFNYLYDAFFKKDIKQLRKYADKKSIQDLNQVASIMLKAKGPDIIIVHYLFDISRTLSLMVAPITGIIIDN